MADNQVEIEVIAKTDLSEVEELESLVEEIKSTAEEEISLSVETGEVESGLEEVEELSTEMENVDGQTVSIDVDTSGIDEAKASLEETASTADNLTTALAGIGATAGIEQMITTADNINTSWNRLDLTFANTGVSMDELKSKTSALSDATGRSGGAIRGYFNQMGIAGVTNTDLLSSSFEALSGKAYQTGNSIESMEAKMQTMVLTGNASGRMLKGLGISAEDLGRAMGVSAEEASKAFKELTPEERISAITKAMGDGAEANEMYKNSYAGLKDRADAAMAGLMGAVGQAILPVVIPALQAATDIIKALTAGFQALPGPVQAVIGGLGGMVAIATAAVGTIGLVGNVVSGVINGFRGLRDAINLINIGERFSGLVNSLRSVASAAQIATGRLIDAGRAALTSAANAVRSAAMWVAEKAAKIASTAASYALAAAQAVLNFVMSMNPIMLIVIAIAALVAALIWAYNNVDWFREGVNNAWQKLQEFAGFITGTLSGALQGLGDAFNNAGQYMQEAFSGAVDFVMGVLQGLFDYITSAGGLIPENVSLTGDQIIDALLGIMMFIQTLPLQIAMVFINVIAQALGFGQNFSQTMMASAMNAINNFITWMATLPSRTYTYLSQVISRVVSWGASLASNFLSAASKSVSNFGSQIAQIPQRLGAELSSALDRVNEWAATLPAKFWEAGVNAVKNFLSALGIASPGTMQRMLVWEVTEMGKRVPEESKQLLTNVSRLGENIVDEFGEPKLGVSFDDTANASFTNLTDGTPRGNVINLNLEIGSVDNEERINEIVEAVRKELAWNNLTAGRTV